jgi:hypothetical protein
MVRAIRVTSYHGTGWADIQPQLVPGRYLLKRAASQGSRMVDRTGGAGGRFETSHPLL